MTTDATGTGDGGCSGCATLIGAALVISAVVAAVMSVASLVDPFALLPPVGDVWAECPTEVPAAAGGSCDLTDRYPGYVWRVIASFAWALAAIGALGWLAVATSDVRDARERRYERPDGAQAHASARHGLVLAATLTALLGGAPLAVWFL